MGRGRWVGWGQGVGGGKMGGKVTEMSGRGREMGGRVR